MLDIQSDQISHIKLNKMLSSWLNTCKTHVYHILSAADLQRQSESQE